MIVERRNSICTAQRILFQTHHSVAECETDTAPAVGAAIKDTHDSYVRVWSSRSARVTRYDTFKSIGFSAFVRRSAGLAEPRTGESGPSHVRPLTEIL